MTTYSEIIKSLIKLAEVVDSHRNDNIFRIKGIVSVLKEKIRCVIQGVLDSFTTDIHISKVENAIICDNFIDGNFVKPKSGEYMDVIAPSTGKTIGKVAVSGVAAVDQAVKAANKAFPAWSSLTVKARAAIMFKFHHLMIEHADELADLVVLENGKNKSEALASVAKGNETVEYACSLPQLIQGKILLVSKGIHCHELREPVGVITSIVPFNFPVMVPMWTVPIALTTGNCVILKPSEKVPLTMNRVAKLLQEAGVPAGVFQIVNGTVDCVNALCDHSGISAVTFVGSSRVAEVVAKRCHALNKRVIALGGAKNHLVALEDADPEMASSDIVASFAGCAGQRCMAASVLLLVGECKELMKKLIEKAKNLKKGTEPGQVGAIIDIASKERIVNYINAMEKEGAKILVDGRSWQSKEGYWVGPTVILHSRKSDAALHEEIFGPVLSILHVKSYEEALTIENSNRYGNAASIYTSSGAAAEYFQSRFKAGMIGVNIGVPVPREPFSFGGLYGTSSKYGDMDITGDGCVEFFTNRRKITTKWGQPTLSSIDTANFAGQM